MKVFFAKVALLVLLVPSSAAAQSNRYEVGAFRAIDVQMGIRVDVTVAPEYAVTAQATKGDLAKFRIKEYLPWLVFERDTRWLMFSKWRDDQFDVTVETPILNGLKAFEDAQATFTGDADERLWIETGSGGRIDVVEVKVDELTLVGREGGTIVAGGQCDQLTIRNESAVIDASGLSCASIVVNGGQDGVKLAPGAVVVDNHAGTDSQS